MKNAFTLIEVLLVIAIFFIISAVFISQQVFSSQQAKLSSSTRDLITDIRYSQQLAVNEQRECGVKFFPEENKYQLLKEESELVIEKSLPSGIVFSQINGLTDDFLKFNAYGAAKESGSIVLQDSALNTKTVDVRPSGFVRIEQ